MHRKRGIVLIVLILLILMTSGCFMYMDRQLVGDEVVTYGMANSTSAGWMLSTGRVRAYFEARILGDSLGEIFGNLLDFGADILKNRRGADYFAFERPAESGWYDHSQIEEWFSITENERFQFGDIYLNAMGDDANSFLYYMLVHLVGSFLPVISATKWSAYLVNAVAFVAALLLLYKISGYFFEEYGKALLVCALFGFSVGGMDISTYLRTYMLAIAMQLGLLLLHLHLYSSMKKGNKGKIRRDILGLMVIYPIGYVTHYTTGLWAGVLGIVTIFYICRMLPKECVKSNLKKYIGAGILAIGIGVLLDPMSALGLVSKLSDAGKPFGQAMSESLLAFVDSVFGGWILFVFFLAVVLINTVYRIVAVRHGEQEPWNAGVCVLAGTILGYCLLVVCLTKFAYFKVVYPIMFIVIVSELEYLGSKVIKRVQIKRVYQILIGIFIVNSLLFTFEMKKSEVIWYDEVQEALEAVDTDKIVLIRPHAEGYDCFPMLARYEKAFVVTTPETEYEILADDEELKETEIITVLITNIKADGEDFKEWVRENHVDMETIETIYESQNRAVLKWTKRV